MRFLLDTHVLIEWHEPNETLRPVHREVIDGARGAEPLCVATITLWEIAMLYGLGRIGLDLPLRDWLERATAPPLVQRVPISSAIATEVAALPSTFHRDPADRIIVASARVLGATLLTRDQRIIDSGVVETV